MLLPNVRFVTWWVAVLLVDQVSTMTIKHQLDEEWSPAEVTLVRKGSIESPNIHVQVKTFGETHESELMYAPRVFSPQFEEYMAVKSEDNNYEIIKRATNPFEQLNIEARLYTNAEGSASLLVDNIAGQVTLEGILNDELYVTKNVRPERSSDSKISHVAFKMNSNNDIKSIAKRSRKHQRRLSSRNSKGSKMPKVVQPEIFLVIEYRLAQYFKNDLNAIKRYLGVFFNSVNRLFATLQSIKIQTVISGIFVLASEEAENAFKVVDEHQHMQDRGTLDKFGKWLYQLKKSKKITTSFDMALWLTTDKLGEQDTNSIELGAAFVGTVCLESKFEEKMRNVGLVTDVPGKYAGVLCMAHEIGHILGAPHDGASANFPAGNPGAAACPQTDGYIMSYTLGSPNRFRFSPCSEKAFKFVINSDSGSCLRDTPSSSGVVTMNNTLPGTILSLDEQCKVSHGDEFRHHDVKSKDEVCVFLYCTEDYGFSGKSSGPALEGSPCDDKNSKWCISGQCVSKSF